MNETHFVIRIPKFAGYKTLFVNMAVLLLGVAGVVYPIFGNAPVDPATIGLFYDSFTGGVVAIIGAINIVLRLLTSTPPATAKLTSSGGSGEQPRYANTADDVQTRNIASFMALGAGQELASHLQAKYEADVRETWLQGVPLPFTVEQAVNEPVQHEAHCTFPHCACHQRCKTLVAVPSTPGEGIPLIEPIIQLSPEERRREHSLLRTAVAFLVPFLLPAMLLGATLSLAGCGTVQAVNAVGQASTLEQRAFALYGTFVTLEEAAAVLVRDTSIPKSVRKAIQAADKRAKPLADRTRSLAVQLNAARAAYQAADATADTGGKLAALTQAMGATLAAFEPALRDFQSKVANGKAGS